jgi:predicted DCC family thiol-disulfide oxidoreductase YuxK
VSTHPRATLLYDDDCSFCRWSADRIRRWVSRGALAFASIQSVTGQELLRSIPGEIRLDSMHVVNADGRVWSGGEAVRVLLDALPGGSLPALVAGSFPEATDRLYRLVARNRTTFGRWLGEEACRLDPSRTSDA